MRKQFMSIALLIPVIALADSPQTFRQSKKKLADLYSDNRSSFYCRCEFRQEGKKLRPDLEGCGYNPRKNANRASRIEWEHVMPAWAFGHQLQCWQEGGRKACRKDPRFVQMEADMHNLVPAIGEVNGDRSNYSFAQLAGERRAYGQCDVEIDFKARKVEPADHIRGDIARTYLYMRDRYGIKISVKQEKLFSAWNRLDPVDSWEHERNKRIGLIQGNLNPYINTPESAKVEKSSLVGDLKRLFSMD